MRTCFWAQPGSPRLPTALQAPGPSSLASESCFEGTLCLPHSVTWLRPLPLGPAALAQKQLESRTQRGSFQGGAGGKGLPGPGPQHSGLMWPEAFDPHTDVSASVLGVSPLAVQV